MPDEIGWPTPEEEAILDRVAALVAAERSTRPAAELEAERERSDRACDDARRYRLAQDAAADLPT